MPNRIIESYLSFTKKERTGIIVLLSLIVLFILIPFLFPLFIKQKPIDPSSYGKEIAALQLKEKDTVVKWAKRNYDEDNDQPYYKAADKGADTRVKGELF